MIFPCEQKVLPVLDMSNSALNLAISLRATGPVFAAASARSVATFHAAAASSPPPSPAPAASDYSVLGQGYNILTGFPLSWVRGQWVYGRQRKCAESRVAERSLPLRVCLRLLMQGLSSIDPGFTYVVADCLRALPEGS